MLFAKEFPFTRWLTFINLNTVRPHHTPLQVTENYNTAIYQNEARHPKRKRTHKTKQTAKTNSNKKKISECQFGFGRVAAILFGVYYYLFACLNAWLPRSAFFCVVSRWQRVRELTVTAGVHTKLF